MNQIFISAQNFDLFWSPNCKVLVAKFLCKKSNSILPNSGAFPANSNQQHPKSSCCPRLGNALETPDFWVPPPLTCWKWEREREIESEWRFCRRSFIVFPWSHCSITSFSTDLCYNATKKLPKTWVSALHSAHAAHPPDNDPYWKCFIGPPWSTGLFGPSGLRGLGLFCTSRGAMMINPCWDTNVELCRKYLLLIEIKIQLCKATIQEWQDWHFWPIYFRRFQPGLVFATLVRWQPHIEGFRHV